MNTDKEAEMKKLAIVVALSVPFILPAQAQDYGFMRDRPGAAAYAQAKKAQKSPKQRATKQKVVRYAHPVAKPCAARNWTGCLGWDPDPNVRAMIRHDSNIFDD
jgi:hypothetical protein